NSSSESIGTPDTQRSVLFDDLTEDSFDLTVVENPYILVVGGLGYIGSHTTLELLKASYNVVVIDDLSNSFSAVLDRVILLASEYCKSDNKPLPSVDFHEVDYKDSSAIRAILSKYDISESISKNSVAPRSSRIAGVIHFAAFKSVEESIEKPLPYYRNNVCGLVDFLDVLQEFGIKNFVFSSSATVYGSKANSGVPLSEEHMVHHPESYFDSRGDVQFAEPGVSGITSPYGRTKYMCEAILADLAHSDPSWSITLLRYFNPVGCHESGLLGEHPRQRPTNLVPVVIRVLTGQLSELNVYGTDYDTADGTAVRDFIHVQDLACGHIAALDAAARGTIKGFRAYNLGTGRGHTVREVVMSLEKASNQGIPAREVGRRKGDVGFCVAAVDRAETELNWKAEKTLEDCARDVWRYTE
ncbi:UDP-glucose 4-epimerase, partial [Eremomyces bilateralis CBS 781.70]